MKCVVTSKVFYEFEFVKKSIYYTILAVRSMKQTYSLVKSTLIPLGYLKSCVCASTG